MASNLVDYSPLESQLLNAITCAQLALIFLRSLDHMGGASACHKAAMWQAELDGGSHIKPSQQGPLKSASIYIPEPANSYTTSKPKDAAFIHLIEENK